MASRGGKRGMRNARGKARRSRGSGSVLDDLTVLPVSSGISSLAGTSSQAVTQSPMNSQPRSADDIIRIAMILRRKLPGDLVPMVLDHAQIWTTLAQCQRAEIVKIAGDQEGLIVLECNLRASLPQDAIRRIKFTTTSRDQGWSSYPTDHGTYRNSWTWFDAGIRRAPSHADIVALQRSDGPEQYVGQQSDQAPRRTIVTNVHAESEWSTHTVIWDDDHKDAEIKDMVSQSQGGDRIELSMFARYPGWTNEVRFASIEIEGVCIKKM